VAAEGGGAEDEQGVGAWLGNDFELHHLAVDGTAGEGCTLVDGGQVDGQPCTQRRIGLPAVAERPPSCSGANSS